MRADKLVCQSTQGCTQYADVTAASEDVFQLRRSYHAPIRHERGQRAA